MLIRIVIIMRCDTEHGNFNGIRGNIKIRTCQQTYLTLTAYCGFLISVCLSAKYYTNSVLHILILQNTLFQIQADIIGYTDAYKLCNNLYYHVPLINYAVNKRYMNV